MIDVLLTKKSKVYNLLKGHFCNVVVQQRAQMQDMQGGKNTCKTNAFD